MSDGTAMSVDRLGGSSLRLGFRADAMHNGSVEFQAMLSHTHLGLSPPGLIEGSPEQIGTDEGLIEPTDEVPTGNAEDGQLSDPVVRKVVAAVANGLADDPEDAEAESRALALTADMELAAATKLMHGVLLHRARRLGNDHILTLMTAIRLYDLLVRQHRKEAAIGVYKHHLSGPLEPVKAQAKRLIDAIFLFAHRLVLGRQLEAAEALYRLLLSLQRPGKHDDRSAIAEALLMLGRIMIERNEPAGAEGMLRQSLTLWERIGQRRPGAVAAAQVALGECLARLGQNDEAIPLLRTACAGIRSRFGRYHPRTKWAEFRLKAVEEAQIEMHTLAEDPIIAHSAPGHSEGLLMRTKDLVAHALSHGTASQLEIELLASDELPGLKPPGTSGRVRLPTATTSSGKLGTSRTSRQ